MSPLGNFCPLTCPLAALQFVAALGAVRANYPPLKVGACQNTREYLVKPTGLHGSGGSEYASEFH